MPTESPDRRLRDWRARTDAAARFLLDEALRAGESSDAIACAAAAYGAAAAFTRGFLQAADAQRDLESADLRALVEAAAAEDAWFARLRGDAALLTWAAPEHKPIECDHILDAMKEIRLVSQARAGALLGFSNQPPERDPVLAQFVVHSTTTQRACSILEHGALYSFNQCVVRGLLSGPALGVGYLLEPRRCLDFVMFHLPDHRFYAGEKVANSHRKGQIDEALTEDYQPSVRLFFRREQLRELPGHEEDGVHEMMVKDAVSLDLLSYALFPEERSLHAALTGVPDAAHARRLRERCAAAPAHCRGDPETYVRMTNQLVIDLEPRR